MVRIKLKAIKETSTGLNTDFININTNSHIKREQAIKGIENGNSNYDGYHVVNPKGGRKPFVRSNPDRSKKNNLE